MKEIIHLIKDYAHANYVAWAEAIALAYVGRARLAQAAAFIAKVLAKK